jgi:micrococcal nuclease
MPLLTIIVCAAVCTAEPLRVVDGDTLVVGRETIRLLDVDAPETFRHRCPAELVAGEAAKDALQKLIAGQHVTIERHGIDRYHRTLARIATPAGDVGAALMRQGHAIPWKPGADEWRKREIRWCH